MCAQYTNTYLPPSPVVPGSLLITGITNAYPAVVTITNSIYNTYIPNQLIHLNIPPAYGMTQANQLTVQIVSIDVTNTMFSVNLDTRGFDVFTVPSPSAFPVPSEPASLSPGVAMNTYNTNIIPFHSLNGTVGN
jgi:hypothetical protein